MHLKALPFVIGMIACGKDSNGTLPSSANSDSDTVTESGGDDGPSGTCGDTWTTNDDSTAIQPETCLKWSPRSDEEMDWYDAASLDDGVSGNCGTDCPEPGDGYCGSQGVSWRLPSIEEIKDAAKSNPDIDDVDGWLWSRDTSATIPGNALTADLSRAGSAFERDKGSTLAWVRCVSDS